MQQPAPAAKVTSPWAIASLMCSAVVVCPLATLLGPLLGMKAIAEIRARPGLKGTPLALAGIFIGLAMTLLWVVAAIWLNANVRQPILDGPAPALEAGFRGDVVDFKSDFIDAHGRLSDAHAIAFINELTRRYGPFQGMEPDPNAATPDPVAPQSPDYLVPYIATFDRAVLEVEAAFVPFENMKPVGKWRWIVIKDDELGDLRYPPSS